MKVVKTPKNLKETPYPPQRKLLKRKGNSITTAKTNAPISQTSSECLKLTKEKFKKEQQKYLQSFVNNATYHPMNPDADYISDRQSIYLVMANVLSTSFLIFHITFDEISTTLYNSGKGRCTRYIWSNDMFVLWNRISAIFYKDIKYCLHFFPKQLALAH